jgi:hydrogenase expression/formation protein HypC
MCLAVPGRVKKIQDGYADIDYGGLFKCASIRIFPDVRVGDCVLVHAGFIIQVLDQDAGEELERLVSEIMGLVNVNVNENENENKYVNVNENEDENEN